MDVVCFIISARLLCVGLLAEFVFIGVSHVLTFHLIGRNVRSAIIFHVGILLI